MRIENIHDSIEYILRKKEFNAQLHIIVVVCNNNQIKN